MPVVGGRWSQVVAMLVVAGGRNVGGRWSHLKWSVVAFCRTSYLNDCSSTPLLEVLMRPITILL